MIDNDKDIRAEFTALAERYRNGQTVFLIDGSGSMPTAYGAGENPIMTAVSYATQVKRQLNPAAQAFFFGESDKKRAAIPIDLDSGENPMRRFPAGPSNFIPAFDIIADAHFMGNILNRLHLVVVSDGGIAEMNNETRDKLKGLLERNPTVFLDVIVPGGMDSDFGKMVQNLLPEGHMQRPLVMTAKSPEELPIVMAKVLNTRCGAQGFYDLNAYEAVNGIAEPVKVRSSPLKLKKNIVD